MHVDRREERKRPRPQPPRPGEARPAFPRPTGPLTEPTAAPEWVAAVQRSAGNRAVAGALAQPIEPAAAPAPAPTTPEEGVPGRAPRPDEVDHLLGVLPDLTEFRILREPAGHYNCFAWAIGDDTTIVGARSQSGLYSDDRVDSWTDWLRKAHGFGRSVDGFDPAADLLLYGSVGWIEHAARKAEVPYGRLTFSSKLGGGNNLSPVIQHDPHEIEGKQYGHIVRSLWREKPATP